MKLVNTRNDLEVISEKYNGNFIMRALFEGNAGIIMVTEVKEILTLVPEDFRYFIENWALVARTLNPMIASIELLPEIDGFGIGKTIAKAPYPMSDRVTFTARYPVPDYKENEHIFIMSSSGLEQVI